MLSALRSLQFLLLGLLATAAALQATPATAAPADTTATQLFSSPNRQWVLRLHPEGQFHFGRQGEAGLLSSLTHAPQEVAVLDSGQGFVAMDSTARPGQGDVVVLVDSAGHSWASHSLSDLFDEATRDAFWQSPGGIAWRSEWWVDEGAGRLVVVPATPGSPVAISLQDGLLETPSPELYVRRLGQEGLWVGSRLRALELAGQTRHPVPGLVRALRKVVREYDSPLVLRLRAAALLQQHDDPSGRSLVMLTARPGPAGSGSLAPLPSAELRIPPQAERRCDQAPAPAIDAPYDAAAARSYAIQLLPSFLGTDAAPWLGALLAGPDEQDRFSALQAIACLASDEAGTSSALLEHVQERYDRELRRLAVRGPLVPPGFEPVPAELWSEALSSDFGRSSDALDDLLERAPASHPILHTLLAEGSPGDRRIAEHFASHPDPRAVSPLLLALGRSPTHAERSEAIIAALQACVPRGRLHPRPPVLQSVEAWQSWGAVWQRRRTLIGGARALTALLPLLLLIGLGLKESRWSGRPTQGLAPGGERG